jgi:hypothetical protein
MRRLFVSLTVVVSLAAGLASAASADMRVGGGLHYLRTVGDIKDTPDFDENAIGIMGSFKYASTLLTFEGDLEFVPDYSGSSELLFEPQGFVLIGNLIYGGIGAGIGYLGAFGWQDPFFALRAGVDFKVGPVDLDVFATYRFQKAGDLSALGNDDLNSITFGALVFFGLGG